MIRQYLPKFLLLHRQLPTPAIPVNTQTPRVTMAETSKRWLVVTGCLIGVLTGPVLVASTFSVFFAALLDSESWSRTAIASAYSLYVIVYGLSGPLVGRWCDRFGPKKVLLAAGILIAGGFILLGITWQVWQFCIVYGLLGVTAGMTGIVPLTTLVFRWFASSRGLAMGVASSGTVGGLFLSPLAYVLIERYGWRMTYLLLGGAAGLLLFVVVLGTVENAPGVAAPDPSGHPAGSSQVTAREKSESGDLSLRQALATQRFWLLSLAGFLFLGALGGVLAHAVPLAQDLGLARGVAAVGLGLIIGLGPLGKIGFGYLADRYPSRKILTISFLLQAMALLLLLPRQGAMLFWVFVVVLALGQGGALAIGPVVVGDLFGHTSLASLVGAYWLIATAGAVVGPPLASVLRQGLGNYSLVVTMFAASMFCAAGLTAMIREQTSSVGQILIASTHQAT
jgi:OFA family oxalate/formate antiporter-like MFS transporter